LISEEYVLVFASAASYNWNMSHLDQRTLLRLMKESEPLLERAESETSPEALWLERLSLHEETLDRGLAAQSDGIEEIRYGLSSSPFGHCRIEAGQKGILALDFLDSRWNMDPAASRALALRRWPKARCVEDAPLVERLAAAIFSRDSKAAIAIHVRGSAFQLRIWRSLLRVPESCLVSYARLARTAGFPGAFRAVGSALASNPIAYIIPCHRVLKADGRLGGFKWGLDRKIAMIAREAALRDTRSNLAAAL